MNQNVQKKHLCAFLGLFKVYELQCKMINIIFGQMNKKRI